MILFSETSLLSLVALCSVAIADVVQTPIRPEQADQIQPHNIAIIGAGAAGSSAAYYLSQFASASEHDLPLNITIFDSNNRVGGRTTTVNALDDPRYPTEVGASIFVKVNHILYNATRDFGLDRGEKALYASTGSAFDLGVWDGASFVFTIANDETEDDGLKGKWRGWWDIVRLLWKYGISPVRVQRASRDLVGRFLQLYDKHFPFYSLDSAVELTDLSGAVTKTGDVFLSEAGVSEQFAREVVQSSTRVNYGQNLGGIHGLETMVCMAIEGAMAVEGGNWQIFNEAVKRSGAGLRLNTTVRSVEKSSSTGKYHLTRSHSAEPEANEFDTIILAAPYQFADLEFSPPLVEEPEEIPYVSLYVSLFTSPHRPSPAYFGLTSPDQVPDTIITTLPVGLDLGAQRGTQGVGPSAYWSLSTLRVLQPAYDSHIGAHVESGSIDPATAELGTQYLYKIFSPTALNATFLARLFAFDHPPAADRSEPEPDPISSISKDHLSWIHERRWDSYPYLPPREMFGSFRLFQEPVEGSEVGEKEKHIWYTSSMEQFISTMETSALSGMNIARQIIDELEQELY